MTMRIVIDGQGYQSASRLWGIGRYARGLTRALMQERKDHDLFLVLNGTFPAEIDAIREAFSADISPERIRVFDIPAPISERDSKNRWRARCSETIREWYLSTLSPDWGVSRAFLKGGWRTPAYRFVQPPSPFGLPWSFMILSPSSIPIAIWSIRTFTHSMPESLSPSREPIFCWPIRVRQNTKVRLA